MALTSTTALAQTAAPATAPAAPPATPTTSPSAADPATAAPTGTATPGAGDELTAEQKKEEGHGALGPVRVGPLIGVVGFPRPIDLGLFAKYKKYAALGISYSFLPINISNIKFYAFEVQGRWFPFKGSFFVGLGMAFQTVSGEFQQGTGGLLADFSQTYVVPRLGWQWMWGGFTIGLDLGVQIPISSSGIIARTGTPGTAAEQASLASTQADMQTFVDLVGKTPLPTLQLFRIGFLF